MGGMYDDGCSSRDRRIPSLAFAFLEMMRRDEMISDEGMEEINQLCCLVFVI